MEEDNKLLELFIQSKVELNDNLRTARLNRVVVNEKDSSWRICITFNQVLLPVELITLQEKISKYVQTTFEIKQVKFSIDYSEEGKNKVDLSQDDLKKYLFLAIDVCKESKKGVLVLQECRINYEYNQICFLVASEEESKHIEENLIIIKKFFMNYGLDFIHFSVEISDDVKNVKELSKERQKIQETLDETKSAEEYRLKKEAAKENYVQSSYRYRATGKVIHVKISDIPLTSMEISEFKQMNETDKVSITGTIVKSEIKNFRSKQGRDFNLLTATITDYKDSVLIKRFIYHNQVDEYKEKVKKGRNIQVNGTLQWDDFARDVVIMCDDIVILGEDISRVRFDEASVKRVELHAHTKMSVLDSILSVEEYVDQAKNYGHKAIAVTDHANCHVLPDLFKLCAKNGIKPIAGVEGYYIDEKSLDIAFTNESIDLKEATYVVFDIETSGLYIPFNEIVEIGAVKIKNGFVIDEFAALVKPKHKLHEKIIEITHITNEMLFDQLPIEEVLPRFKAFIDGCILVAHNAHFDSDFIYAELQKLKLFEKPYPCIDTMMFARGLYGSAFKQNNLRAVGKFLKVEVEPNEQHRAVYDAKTTGNIFNKLLSEALVRKITNYNQLNQLAVENELFRYKIPNHINILVKNKKGLKNFYKIISESHTTYFQKDARILKSLIENNREGILVGSGCCNGEIFRLALEKTYQQLLDAMDFYDYIEVQPPCCYRHLFDMWNDDEARKMTEEIIKEIIDAAMAKNKIVVATGDVHELIQEDGEYRKIYLSVARPNGGGPHELSHYKGTLDMHYRSTSEMLEEFSFLDSDLAYKIVVTNTNIINDMIESYELFPKKLYVPRDDFMLEKTGVPSMKNAVYDISYQTAYKTYGNPLPLYVQELSLIHI